MKVVGIAVLCAGVCVGCSSDDSSEGTHSNEDASSDAQNIESGTDASPQDAQADAPLDAGGDAAPGPPPPAFLYVSVGAESRLAVLRLSEDGMLTARTDLDLALPQHPRALGWDPPRRRLYAGLPNGAIATIDIDPAGAPSLAGTTPGQNVGEPVYVAVSADGTHLISAYFGDDLLRVQNASGAPPHAISGSIATADEPHCSLVHAGLVYVPHRNGETTRWYSLASDGKPSLAGELASEAGVGPRHIAFSPSGDYAYIVNEYGDSVSAHSVASDGSLTRFETVSILPSGVDGSQNSSADIHVSPDGLHVYASNRGHDSIAVLNAASDGSLTLVDDVPTETTPREFDLSPSGRHLLVAGQGSGYVASYLVGSDGALTQADRLQVAGDLRWIVTVEDE
jgi:6-phosphogluconolactonase (cycloisomerase 2 family)